MSANLKEFDKLEERIRALVKTVRALREENERLKRQLHEFQESTSQKDTERTEIKKKITSLMALVDSLEQDG